MQSVKVPGINSVRLTRVLSTEKLIIDPLIYISLKAKSNTTLNGIESPKSKMVDAFKQLLCRLSYSILCLILNDCADYYDLL